METTRCQAVRSLFAKVKQQRRLSGRFFEVRVGGTFLEIAIEKGDPFATLSRAASARFKWSW
jgi:hypothetical protein